MPTKRELQTFIPCGVYGVCLLAFLFLCSNKTLLDLIVMAELLLCLYGFFLHRQNLKKNLFLAEFCFPEAMRIQNTWDYKRGNYLGAVNFWDLVDPTIRGAAKKTWRFGWGSTSK